MRQFLITLLTITLVASAAIAVEKAEPKPAKPAEAVKFAEPLTPAPAAEKKLAPLVQDNSALLASWMSGATEQPCGVACPKCGKEMLLNVKLQLCTTPPARIVRCPDGEKCKFATAVF